MRALMAICVLVALLALPGLIHGRPAANSDQQRGSTSNVLVTRGTKLAGLLNHDEKAISMLSEESESIPAKTRQRRWSDQRRAELETLVTLWKMNGRVMIGNRWKLLNRRLDPARIGRRRRSAKDPILTEKMVPVRHHTDKLKLNGDAAYPLIS